jgi:hypothetical protein
MDSFYSEFDKQNIVAHFLFGLRVA